MGFFEKNVFSGKFVGKNLLGMKILDTHVYEFFSRNLNIIIYDMVLHCLSCGIAAIVYYIFNWKGKSLPNSPYFNNYGVARSNL